MKINYNELGKVTEIKFEEGENQAAFWEFMKNRDKELTQREHELTQREHEITEREKELTIRYEKWAKINYGGFIDYNCK